MKALLWIAGVLVALWALLWLGLEVVSFAVHLLLFAAVALVVWWAVKRTF